VASPDVQWLLHFKLACTCQMLQHKSKHRQQQQQPYEQLLTALGLPANVQYIGYCKLKWSYVAVVMTAVDFQMIAAITRRQLIEWGGDNSAAAAAVAPAATDEASEQLQVPLHQQHTNEQHVAADLENSRCRQASSSSSAGVAAAAAAAAAADDLEGSSEQLKEQLEAPSMVQQQQQQILDIVPVLEQPLQLDAAQENDAKRLHSALPAHLLQPLLLTLLQLCTELMSNLTLMRVCVNTMDGALRGCAWFCKHMEQVAAAAQSTVEMLEDGTRAIVLAPQQNTAEPPPPAAAAAAAAKAEMETAYREARRVVAQPLLHVLGPAVLKEVQRVDQGLNRGSVSSRIAPIPGMTAEQSAVVQADALLGAFGRVVLRVITGGELRRCCLFTPFSPFCCWLEAVPQ
jgi:hypothetical protein